MSNAESNTGEEDRKSITGEDDIQPVDQQSSEDYSSLLQEMKTVDAESYPIVHRLIVRELQKISITGEQPEEENKDHIDLISNEPVTLVVKCMLPQPKKGYPKVNYIGKILGPKGSYLKALKGETKTRIVILGKGTLKDNAREDELRMGNDPRYYHLHEDMHVEIQVKAPAVEAHAKIAYAVKCLRQQVMGDVNDLPWIIKAKNQMEQDLSEGIPTNYRDFTNHGTFWRPSRNQSLVPRISHRAPFQIQTYYGSLGFDSSRNQPRMSAPHNQSGSALTLESISKMRPLSRPYSTIGKETVSSGTSVFDVDRKNTFIFNSDSHFYDDSDDDYMEKFSPVVDPDPAAEMSKVWRERATGSNSSCTGYTSQSHSQRYFPYTKKHDN